jgi:hypothetical protein
MNIPPYSNKVKGKIKGNELLFIYEFARTYGYKINLLEAKNLQDQVDCLKNKSCNLAGGLFPILDEYRTDITYSNVFHPSISGVTIRYENSEKFLKIGPEWPRPKVAQDFIRYLPDKISFSFIQSKVPTL